MKWVQDSIANFGGDVNRVTIFGERWRGFNQRAFASLEERNLFHRAIIESGSAHGGMGLRPPSDANMHYERIKTYLKCSDAECMRKFNESVILDAGTHNRGLIQG